MATKEQIKGFTDVTFPVVRRVFPSLIARSLVSVQPMSVPAGGIFHSIPVMMGDDDYEILSTNS